MSKPIRRGIDTLLGIAIGAALILPFWIEKADQDRDEKRAYCDRVEVRENLRSTLEIIFLTPAVVSDETFDVFDPERSDPRIVLAEQAIDEELTTRLDEALANSPSLPPKHCS